MPQMPPPGPPPGPQQGPPPGAGAPSGAPPAGSDAAGGMSALIINAGKALDHINTVVGQSQGVNPQSKQMISQSAESYGKFMASLSQGPQEPDADDGGGGGGQGQTVPQEAGGNKGAVPSRM